MVLVLARVLDLQGMYHPLPSKALKIVPHQAEFQNMFFSVTANNFIPIAYTGILNREIVAFQEYSHALA